MSQDSKKTHPAYGNIQFSRVSGMLDMYDSPLTHGHVIAMRVSQASFEDGTATRWHQAEKEIVEVYMTPAQFAEAITSIGTSGVPCTLSRYRDPVTGEVVHTRMEREDKGIRERHEDMVKEYCDTMTSKSDHLLEKVADLIKKGKAGKGDLTGLMSEVQSVRRHISENMPYLQERFAEATEREVSRAKIEMVATADQIIHSKGLKSMGVNASRLVSGNIED